MPTRVALCPEGLEEQIRRQLSCLQRANEHSNELQQQENHESTEAVVNELVDQKSPTELQASYVPKSNGGLRVEDNQPVEICLSGKFLFSFHICRENYKLCSVSSIEYIEWHLPIN